MDETLKLRVIHYIVTNINKKLFLSMDEAIRLAYAKAQKRVQEDFKNINPARPRSQLRRYMIDDALTSVLAKGNPLILQTTPKGEHYFVICSGNVTLSHIELHKNTWARPAKHRTSLAKKNAILEPINFDLFNEPPPRLDDALHVVAVVLHPQLQADNQSEPSEILITVPYTDWMGYHLEMPLREFLQHYENEREFIQVDEAWATLRDDLQKEEKISERKSG